MLDGLQDLTDRGLLLLTAGKVAIIEEHINTMNRSIADAIKHNGEQDVKIDDLESWKDKLTGGAKATAKISGGLVVIMGLVLAVLRLFVT